MLEMFQEAGNSQGQSQLGFQVPEQSQGEVFSQDQHEQVPSKTGFNRNIVTGEKFQQRVPQNESGFIPLSFTWIKFKEASTALLALLLCVLRRTFK